MPLTTRCRRCGRLFPVYAQQLKERRGKAECPQCGNRFNAVAALIDEPLPGDPGEDGRASARRRRHGTVTSAPILTLPPARRRAGGRPLLWLAGILVLAAGLALQAVWWERTYWLSDPLLRAQLDGACAAVGCRVPLPRLAGTMEILTPSLSIHPQDPEALRLALTLVNRAQVPQRLPLLQLELYDDAGNLTAARRFTPARYLPGTVADAGLAAGAATGLSMDLAMPPEAPAGFRIRLL